jgi:hypothetical protein
MYLYIYLNPLKKGSYIYDDLKFDYEPFYVGIGVGDRYKMHLYESHLKKDLKGNTIRKIKKNNCLPIIIKLYENLTKEEAYKKEIELIEKIGRKDLKEGTLTNRTNGGDSGGYKHEEKILKKISTPILCYDKKGNLIKEYSSIKEASKYLNISRSNISQSCRYLVKICDNKYYFRYKNPDKNIFYEKKNKKYRIIRISYDGKVKRYERMKDAVKDTGISYGSIYASCNGINLCGGNYFWRYEKKKESFYKKVEEKYGFDMNAKVIDQNNNIYLNALHASISTNITIRRVCDNLNLGYSVKKNNFQYING